MMHTVSSVRCWRTCRRLYRYKYLDLVRPAITSKALGVGSAVHAGLESFHAGADLYDVMRASMAVDVIDDTERARVSAMLAAYHHHWAPSRSEWSPVEIEGEFRMQMAGAEVGGKMDALMRHVPTGRLFLWESKTTSEEVGTVGADYWQRLAMDLQVTTYQLEIHKRLGEMPGIIYDVIRKPLGEPKLKQRIAKRKSETQEEYKARKEAARETLDEFQYRIMTTMLNAPGDYLVRREVHKTLSDAGQTIAELEETLREIDSYAGSYPRNDTACRSKFGTCAYLGVCTGAEQLDSERFVRVESAHTELSHQQEDAHDFDDCPI